MSQKGHRPDEISAKPPEAEVLLGEGREVREVVRALGAHEVTHCRWRKGRGGLKVSQAKGLKDLASGRPRRLHNSLG